MNSPEAPGWGRASYTRHGDPSDITDSDQEYWNRRVTARYLGITAGTLANWSTRHYGPQPIKIPGKRDVLYVAAEVRQFVETHRASGRGWSQTPTTRKDTP